MEEAGGRVWVTRSEFSHFCRCPYAFSMVQLGLVALGAAGERREITFPRAVYRLFCKRHWTINWSQRGTVYRNEALRIAGKPHGVDKSDGAMIPIAVFDPEGLIEPRPHKLT